jgi:hypothetical protein
VTVLDKWTESLISELRDEDIKDFEDIVISDLKNNEVSDIEKDILRSNLDLWLYSLRCLRRDIEFQLTSNKIKMREKVNSMKNEKLSEFEISSYIDKQERWKAGASKFLVSIERRTLYVKLLIAEEDD